MTRTAKRAAFLLSALALVALSGCDMLDMYDEPRFEPLEASTFFDDGTSARPLVAGTVARGDLREDEGFYSGKVDGKYVTTLPVDLDEQLLVRGQERFNIYCSPCHGRVGDGNGMIVERGFRRPPSFVGTPRLIDAPVGHFYDVISNGFGAMPSYASRVAPHDRWAIVAYIRALQRSQNGSVDDVPPELRDKIAESQSVEEQDREKREEAEQQQKIESERKQGGTDNKQSANQAGVRRYSLGVAILRPHPARLDGEGDGFASKQPWPILFTIQTSWMGSLHVFSRNCSSSPSISPSAQGGWGRKNATSNVWRGLARSLALKGRHGARGTARSHPVGVPELHFAAYPGRCPGLMTTTPSGSVAAATQTAGEENRRSSSEALV